MQNTTHKDDANITELNKFKQKLEEVLDKQNDHYDKFDVYPDFPVTLTLDGFELTLPMNADLWESLYKLIQDEIDWLGK